MGEGRSTLSMLTGKVIGERSIREPRNRWKKNVRMDRKIGYRRQYEEFI
jgi:hypothetical protein